VLFKLETTQLVELAKNMVCIAKAIGFMGDTIRIFLGGEREIIETMYYTMNYKATPSVRTFNVT
jgi:hypothetical protein